ncbi:hypothetical protein RND71_009089 [Anisodus tanguticus]|uniref:Uncharacterized protein n=1 Tax=Anisodus tanguticus TaxID=243964 RepID=A0AAE1VUR7_9SOLA|nr:hypothetical protein RND71_009089 [Anisodus tanguticus]
MEIITTLGRDLWKESNGFPYVARLVSFSLMKAIIEYVNEASLMRNQQKRTEAAPPSPFKCQNEEIKSPMAASNARTLRRQSLTGIPPPTMSRRSSLGGGSLPDSCK